MTSLIAVSSYTDTDILAHTPKGAENDQGITCAAASLNVLRTRFGETAAKTRTTLGSPP